MLQEKDPRHPNKQNARLIGFVTLWLLTFTVINSKTVSWDFMNMYIIIYIYIYLQCIMQPDWGIILKQHHVSTWFHLTKLLSTLKSLNLWTAIFTIYHFRVPGPPTPSSSVCQGWPWRKINWDVGGNPRNMGVNPKIGVFTPKMDGENNGKPY